MAKSGSVAWRKMKNWLPRKCQRKAYWPGESVAAGSVKRRPAIRRKQRRRKSLSAASAISLKAAGVAKCVIRREGQRRREGTAVVKRRGVKALMAAMKAKINETKAKKNSSISGVAVSSKRREARETCGISGNHRRRRKMAAVSGDERYRRNGGKISAAKAASYAASSGISNRKRRRNTRKCWRREIKSNGAAVAPISGQAIEEIVANAAWRGGSGEAAENLAMADQRKTWRRRRRRRRKSAAVSSRNGQ